MQLSVASDKEYRIAQLKETSSPLPTRISNAGYRPDIDGLRAIAVLSVVGFHAFPSWVGGGFVGVDVFFVISGFLISGLIMREVDDGTFSLKRFYARRVRRIFPALGLILLFCLIGGWIALAPSEYEQLAKHVAGGAAFADNFIFWREAGYFDNAADTKPLLHLWSLGIEEQFYLAWPPVLLILWRKSRSLSLPLLGVLGASLAFSLLTARHDAVADFYSPLTRLWELLLGAGVAGMLVRKPDVRLAIRGTLAGLGLLLILIAVTVIDKGDRFPGAWAMLPTLGTALVILGEGAWLNRRVLSNSILVWVGLISYPLYLWHWPLLSFARILESETPSATVRILLVLTSVLFAWLTYLLLERPIRFGHRSRRAVSLLCCFMLVLLIAALAIRELDGLKSRQQSMLNGDPGTLAVGADRDKLKKQCGVDDEKMSLFQFCLRDGRQEPRYAILGDSKAEALFYGLVRESKPNHRWMLIGSVSPPADQVTADRRQVRSTLAYETVETNRNLELVVLANALRSTFSLQGDTGFVEAGLPPSALESTIAAYSRAIKRFEEAGKHVAFVVDNPTLPDPRSCISGGLTWSSTLNQFLRRKDNPRCTLRYTDHLAGTRPYRDFIQKLKQANPGLIVYDPTPLLCDVAANVCTVTRDGNFLYSYGDHISDYANSLIARDMLQITDALIR